MPGIFITFIVNDINRFQFPIVTPALVPGSSFY